MFEGRSIRTAKSLFPKSAGDEAETLQSTPDALPIAIERLRGEVAARFDPAAAQRMPRRDLASEIRRMATEFLARERLFRHFDRAIAWEQAHVGRLLRAS